MSTENGGAAPIRVGFWRPLVEGPDDRPEERDGRLYWPVRVAHDLDEHPDVASRARDLARYVETGRCYYVSESDLRRAGAADVREYLRLRLERERERARADMDLPVPVPGSLDPDAAERLARWLEGGAAVASYRGYSTCRVCGCRAGSRELARDGYLYPEGLVHYVREHRVAVPGLEVEP